MLEGMVGYWDVGNRIYEKGVGKWVGLEFTAFSSDLDFGRTMGIGNGRDLGIVKERKYQR